MSSTAPLKIGLLGAGHLGKIHARCLAELADAVEVVGVYDPEEASAKTVRDAHGYRVFDSSDALFAACDAVDVVTPTSTHFVLAKAALEAGCHVFVEKPVTERVAEAEALESLAAQRGLSIQVGHVERFNPAFATLGHRAIAPVFVEAHRLAEFNPRSTDVSVVLDLMIHDIDLVLSLIDAEVEDVSASGVGVVGESVDIANARLDFANGATANLTASRISLKSMRKLRLFQRDAYIGVDLLGKATEVVTLSDHDPAAPGPLQLPTEAGLREIVIEHPPVAPVNAIREELRSFAAAIAAGESPAVTIADGRRALAVAHRVLGDIEARRAKLLASL